MKKVVGLSGNLERPSKTRALVKHAVEAVQARYGVQAALYDLSDLSPSLGASVRATDLVPEAARILGEILAADALVIASPTYKGSYTGLFKHLVDLIDPIALRDKPIVLAATGGGDRHALIIEHQLRPLFGFFEALTVPTGVYASDKDFSAGSLVSPQVIERLNRAIEQLSPWLDTISPEPVLPRWAEHATGS
jgi:FMN reductase